MKIVTKIKKILRVKNIKELLLNDPIIKNNIIII